MTSNQGEGQGRGWQEEEGAERVKIWGSGVLRESQRGSQEGAGAGGEPLPREWAAPRAGLITQVS